MRLDSCGLNSLTSQTMALESTLRAAAARMLRLPLRRVSACSFSSSRFLNERTDVLVPGVADDLVEAQRAREVVEADVPLDQVLPIVAHDLLDLLGELPAPPSPRGAPRLRTR